MSYQLPKLLYAFDALEPYIDAKTMELHYTKHHQGYIDNLNAALAQHPELQRLPLHELLANLGKVPEAIRTAVRNNGGGHDNHTRFWCWMTPQGGGEPVGDIGRAISQKFGNFNALQEQMNLLAKTRFGSGWAWLVLNTKGDLAVTSTANQDTPLSEGMEPLLGIDVWEHAYYLKYQNRRVDYIAAWWHTVNWSYVDEQYRALR
jgi:Fe-Mn family superoxide dismutase